MATSSRALGPYETALAAWRESGDRSEIANALYNLAFCYAVGRLSDEEGVRRATRSSTRRWPSTWSWATNADRPACCGAWGRASTSRARTPRRPRRSQRALPLAQRIGDRTLEAWTRHQLGTATLKLGDVAGAQDHMRKGLALFDAAGDVAGVTLAFDDLAAVAAAEGDLPNAARLQALARRLQAASGTGLAGVVDEAFEQATRPNAANRLSPEDLARYRDETAAVTLEDGVRFALGRVAWAEIAPVGPRPARPPRVQGVAS